MQERQFVAAMGNLIGQYLEEAQGAAQDPEAVIRSLGITTAYVLSTVIREAHLLPDEVDTVLTQFCQTLREVTLAIVRDQDAAP